MAGLPWIEVHTDLPTHPKSVRLGLKLGDRRAWTYMVELWLWCSEQVPDGRFEGEDAVPLVAFAAGWTGDASTFVTAAIECGFIDREGDVLKIHDLAERLAAHIAKREKDRKRQAKARKRIAKRFGEGVVTRESRVSHGGVAGESPGNSNPNSNPNPDQKRHDEEGANEAIALTEDRRWPEAFVVYRHILAVCCVTRMPSGEVDWENLQAEAVRIGVDVACQEVTRAVEAKRKRHERIAHLSFFVAALKRAARPVAPEERDASNLPENKRNWVTA